MKCNQVQPNLLDYSQGLLNLRETATVKVHLESCEACQAVLKEETMLVSRLEAVPPVAAASDVWAKVHAQAQMYRQPSGFVGRAVHVYARRLVAAGAAVVVLGATLLVTSPWNASKQMSQKDSIRQAATLIQVQPASSGQDEQLTRTTDDMMKVIEREF